MKEFLQIIAAAAICLAVMAVIWYVKGRLFFVAGSCASGTRTVIVAGGNAEELEHTVRSLRWLRLSGRAKIIIAIEDAGLTPDARRRAEILANRYGMELYRRKTDQSEETVWSKTS